MTKVHYSKLCNFPWTTLLFFTDGSYDLCLSGGGPIGRIKNSDDVKDVWNSNESCKFRETMLQEDVGKLPNQCKRCIFFKNVRNSEYIDTSDQSTNSYGNLINRDKNASMFCHESPRDVLLYSTEKCNGKCFMCATGQRNRQGMTGKSMSIDLIEEIAKSYFKGSYCLNSNCLGEIFLHENFKKFMKIITMYRPKYVYTNTNGSLNLTEDYWKYFMEAHDCIYFSIDSSTKKTHRLIRGFDRDNIFRNIDIIRKLRDSDFPNFNYGFSMVIMKINIFELYNFVRKSVEEWGGTKIGFQLICDQPQESVLLDPMWQSIYNDQLRQVKKFALSHPDIEIPPLGYCFDEEGKIIGIDGEVVKDVSTDIFYAD